VLERALESELTAHLGYEKGGRGGGTLTFTAQVWQTFLNGIK
jgi:hypothetical protein